MRVWPLVGVGAFTIVLVALGATAHDDAFEYPYLDLDHPAIQYEKSAADDPVARLQKDLDQGKTKLEYEPGKGGYLLSLLKHLDLNTDSQMLVFSKTSFQAPRISPKKPRAIYFNDQAAVGYVQGGDVLEVQALDPRLGVLFYTLDVEKTSKPTFQRRTDGCLQCHGIPGTLNVPGLLITSVYPSPDGSPRFPAAALIVDSRTALEKRWGGWYVTGTSGGLIHRGNSLASRADQPDVLDLRGNQNLTSLEKKFDTSAYPAPGSDIVALMTIEHQTRMVNMMVRLGWETRVAMNSGTRPASFNERLDFLADQLVRYMLFADEARIYEPIAGSSTFTKTFAERGPRDKQGRSLRDFDLEKRLFRYPLSYMIYSSTFDGLPEIAKSRVYQKLYDVLTAKAPAGDSQEPFARLSAEDRSAVLGIVRDTKPDLPAYFRK